VTKPAIASAGVAWSSAATTNLISNPSFEDTTATTTARTNLATNPGFEASSSTATIRTNLILNPNFAATSTTTTSRINLCTNPSFEHATTPTNGWLGAGATPNTASIAVSTAQKYVGSQSLLVTYAAGTGGTNNGAGYALSLPATTTYTYSAYVYTPTGSVLPQLSVQGTSFAVTSTNATLYDTWERLSVTFTTTTAQNYTFYVLNSATVAVGKTFYLDAVLIDLASTTRPYFDGNTAAANEFTYAWSSTTNLSTSLQQYSAAPNYSADLAKSIVARSSTTSYLGTYSGLVTSLSSSGNLATYSYNTAVTAGTTYVGSLYVKDLSLGGNIYVNIDWRGSGGYISTSGGTATAISTGSWTRISVTGVAPSGAGAAAATGASLVLVVPSTAAYGSQVYIDAAMLEAGSSVNTYFDGSTTAAGDFTYTWNGTADASTSNQVANMVDGWVSGYNPGNLAYGRYRTSADKQSGSYSYAVNVYQGTGASQLNLTSDFFANGSTFASKTYTASVYVYASRAQTVSLFMTLGTGSGSLYPSTAVSVTAGTWTRISRTYTMPSDLTTMKIELVTNPSAGDVFYYDQLLVEQSSQLKSYFDGSTTAAANLTYAWSGTANASTSVQQYLANPSWGSLNSISAVASASQFYIGTKSALVTADGFGTFGIFNSGVAFAWTAVTVGVTYTSSIYVRDVNTAVSYYAGIEWRNSGGSSFSTINGTSKTVTSSGWTRISVTATAPLGAVTAGLVFYSTATPASGTQAYFDGAVFEASSTPTSYFDGSVTAIAPGTTYSASLYVKIPVGQEASSLRLYLYWYDFTGTQLSFATGALIPMVSDEGWVRLAVTAVAPADAVIAQIRLYQPTAGTAGQKFLIDAAMLEASAYVNEYTDDFSQGQETTKVNNALRPVPYPHLTGMQLNADVNINGLILNTIDEDSIVWVCTGINGWWGQTQSDIQDLPRGLGDGSYDVVGRYTARQIELKGSILPPDASYIDAARNKLVKAIDLVRTKGWLLADESPVKGAQVRLSGQPTIDVVNARGRMDFSVGLRAPDPIKYHYDTTVDEGFTKSTITSGGSATFNNIGNTNVCALMTVTGPFTANSVIKNTTTNQSIKMLSALSAAGLSLGPVTAVKRVTTDGVKYATVSVSTNYKLAVGDSVTIASVGNSFDGTFVVQAVNFTSSTTLDLTYVYTGASADYAYAAATGTVTLTNNEFMVIDTYNRDVFLNNNTTGSRELLDTLVDWIVIQPGVNTIKITDAGSNTTGTLEVKFRSGWIG